MKEKCDLCLQDIKFLGHRVGLGTVRMDEMKVNAVVDWPEPGRVLDLRNFLGLANYYLKFINNYSNIAAPLMDLLNKDIGWN